MSAPVISSVRALLADGWTRCARRIVPYGSDRVGRVILERGDEVLLATYFMDRDGSDWQGDDWPHTRWTRGRLREVEMFEIVEVTP